MYPLRSRSSYTKRQRCTQHQALASPLCSLCFGTRIHAFVWNGATPYGEPICRKVRARLMFCVRTGWVVGAAVLIIHDMAQGRSTDECAGLSLGTVSSLVFVCQVLSSFVREELGVVLVLMTVRRRKGKQTAVQVDPVARISSSSSMAGRLRAIGCLLVSRADASSCQLLLTYISRGTQARLFHGSSFAAMCCRAGVSPSLKWSTTTVFACT